MLLQQVTLVSLVLVSLFKINKCFTVTSPRYEWDGHRLNNLVYHIESLSNGSRSKVLAKVIYTAGCKIPGMMVDYTKYINRSKKTRTTCGKRAVFLRKVDESTVQAFIKKITLRRLIKRKRYYFKCCYRFIIKVIPIPDGKRKIILTNCTYFENNSNISLQSDFINVLCFKHIKQKMFIVYDDMYAFAKKKKVNKLKKPHCKKYNVLMLGLDSMSLPRAMQTLPRTMNYFDSNFWLSYRGYHKIGDNTYPNLMALLTGKGPATVLKKCLGKMDNCNHFIIWSAFKKAGYITGYGQDDQLADLFRNEYEFTTPPTDHYMRPFFLSGEYSLSGRPFLCIGKTCSGQHILDYALDFATTYKDDSFFGLFWINSFSHNPDIQTHAADKIIENFFKQLAYIGILSNTFVIFFSDHGIRYGPQRLQVESYYDERMPMFFIWLPSHFKTKYDYEPRAVLFNQFRLVTPYDIFSTLLDIKRMSSCNTIRNNAPEGCPNCHSIFKIISRNRTCEDASIHPKWCSCHDMYPLSAKNAKVSKIVKVVVSDIQSKQATIKTRQCFMCMRLSLKKIVRIHYYDHEDKVSRYYVVAVLMSPSSAVYEATVLKKNDAEGVIVGKISILSGYQGYGNCTLNNRNRLFCVCKKMC